MTTLQAIVKVAVLGLLICLERTLDSNSVEVVSTFHRETLLKGGDESNSDTSK